MENLESIMSIPKDNQMMFFVALRCAAQMLLRFCFPFVRVFYFFLSYIQRGTPKTELMTETHIYCIAGPFAAV